MKNKKFKIADYFSPYKMQFGDIHHGDKLNFTFTLNPDKLSTPGKGVLGKIKSKLSGDGGKVAGIYAIQPGCGCTHAEVSEDGLSISGYIDVTKAVGKDKYVPMNKSIKVIFDTGVRDLQIVDDKGNLVPNPEVVQGWLFLQGEVKEKTL